MSKPACRYGVDCYRKNPDHLRKFSHPSSRSTRAARRTKRAKLRDSDEAVSYLLSQEEMARLNSPLQTLSKEMLMFLLPYLRADGVQLLRRCNKHLRARIDSLGSCVDQLYVDYAKKWLTWDFSKWSQAVAIKKFRQKLAKMEDCHHCGHRCKGIHFPDEWRERGMYIKQKMCLDCFGEFNPNYELVKAGDTGLSADKRRHLTFAKANIGYQDYRRYYLRDDLP